MIVILHRGGSKSGHEPAASPRCGPSAGLAPAAWSLIPTCLQASRNVLAPVGETEHQQFLENSEELAVGSEGSPRAEVEGHATEKGRGLSYLRKRRNVFEALVEAVTTRRLGQISHAPFGVSGDYRRNM